MSFIGKSVVLHANTKDMKMDLLTVAKEVNKLGKYATGAIYNQEELYTYRKIASFNTSRLEAHAGFFRLLMKGINDHYVL